MEDSYILKVNHLEKSFNGYKNKIKAVDDVSFTMQKGEVLGLVGESGSGKTTLARMITSLCKQDKGEIYFENKLISKGEESTNRKEQILINNLLIEKEPYKDIQMIFQDPISSLNPRMTIRDIVAEGLEIKAEGNKEEITQKVIEALNLVGLSSEHLNRYANEFSGGQRQRIAIARALILKPKLLIADEIVSSLDISIQAQIINLLIDLKKKMNLSILFIAHNLQVIKYVTDRVLIMYKGKIIESAKTDELFSCRIHPYTKKLFDSVFSFDPINAKKEKTNFEMNSFSNSGTLKEIKKDHFVLLNDEEYKMIKEELNYGKS